MKGVWSCCLAVAELDVQSPTIPGWLTTCSLEDAGWEYNCLLTPVVQTMWAPVLDLQCHSAWTVGTGKQLFPACALYTMLGAHLPYDPSKVCGSMV